MPQKKTINYDYFNEDDVEQEILCTKPTSFFLYGKPHSERKKLAKLIAENWNCVHVDVTSLCEEVIEEKKLPPEVLHNLYEGKAVGDPELMKEVCKKLRSNIIAHRGYILTGLPTVEHCNVAIFNSQIEILKNVYPQPDFLIYLKMDNEDVYEMMLNKKFDPQTGTIHLLEPEYIEKVDVMSKRRVRSRPRLSTSVNSSIVAFSEMFEEVEETENVSDIIIPQLLTFQSSKSRPSVSAEVMSRLIIPQEFLPSKAKSMLECYHNMFEPIFYNEYLAHFNKLRVFELNALKSAQVLLTEVLDRLKCFHCSPAYLAMPFYVNLREMEERRKAEKKLKNTPESKKMKWGVSKSSVFEQSATNLPSHSGATKVESFIPLSQAESGEEEEVSTRAHSEGSVEGMVSENESEEFHENEQSNVKDEIEVKPSDKILGIIPDSQLTEEEFFQMMANTLTIDPKWKWHKSKWFHYCPVALTKGFITPGLVEYSVRYLDKIYALSSLEALKTFVENPRPFLKAPKPKNHCKVIVTGFPYSGKTTASQALAKVYGARVIDINEVVKPAVDNMKAKHREEILKMVIRDLTDKMAEKAVKQQEKLQGSLLKQVESRSVLRVEQDSKLSKEFEVGEEEKQEEEQEEEVKEDEEQEEQMEEDDGNGSPDFLVNPVLEDSNLNLIAVEEEEEDVDGTFIGEDDPDVIEAVEERMKNYSPELSPGVLMVLLEEAVIKLQKELTCERKEPVLDGGWVIDNFPLRLRHWDALMKSSSLTRPTTIFYLIDESIKKEITISRWYNANRREINQKIIARLQDSITQELVEERKNELGNLLDDLEAGELIDSERISKRTSSKREEGSDSEHEVKEDERTEILSRYVPSPGKESQGEKLSGMSRYVPVRVEAPRLEDDNEWIKSDRSVAVSQVDYYQGEKKPSPVDVNDIDDEDSDDELQNKKSSNTNRSNYQVRELNRSDNRNIFSEVVGRARDSIDMDNTSLTSSKLRSRYQSSKKTLRSSRKTTNKRRRTGKGNVLTSLGLAFDPQNESFINNLNKFAVYKSNSLDQARSLSASKANIMDNLTNISDDVSEKMSDDSDLVQVACLIQNLLGILWYLPLDGPEKSKMEDDLQLVIDRLNAIMESMKSHKVLLKKIIIGTKLEVPRIIYTKTPRKMSKKSTKHDNLGDEGTQTVEVVSPTSEVSPEEDEEAYIEEMEIPVLDETSVKSGESEGMPKVMEDEVDEEGVEEEQSVEKATEAIQDFPDLEHLDLSFHHLKYFSSFLGNIGNLLSQEWDSKDTFTIVDEMIEHLEELFRYKAVEGAEVDEVEEEEEAEEEEEIQEEEREKVESKEKFTELQKTYKKFNFGDTSYFCPVALKEDRVLHPGSSDITASYRDKIYFFSSEEAQQKFLKMPHLYVAGKLPLQTPPLRLLIMGPPGSGKSTLSRDLVNKLGICHIQFKKYLQEMIIARTKRMILRDDDGEEEDVEDFNMLEKEEIKERLRAMGKMNWEKKKEDFLTSGLSASLLQVSSMTKFPSPERTRAQEYNEPPPLTEKEQAIADYLTSITLNPSQANLPKNILEEILKEFWNGQTFSKSGFILEDFPNNETELKQMVEFGLYPDAILVLETDVSESLKRMLPNLIKKWKEKVQKKKSFELNMAESYKYIKKEAMEARKKELLTVKNKVAEALKGRKKRFSSSSKGVRFISDDEMTEMMDIMEKFLLEFDVAQILMNEFEEEDQIEEEGEDEEEKEAEAEERIKQSFVQLYDNTMDTLARLIETQQELRIPTISVNSSKRFLATIYSLNENLEPFLKKRRSLFEKVIPVPMQLAEEMIKSGYKTLSRFNRWCPVKALDGNPTCEFPEGPSHAAVHRSFVYFLSSKSNLAKFMHDPIYYLCNSPTKVCIPIRCSITGPPKSGKTTIANRLKAEYGVRRISPGDAIRTLIADFPKSYLVKRILVMLYSGHALSPDLTSKAISKILLDTDCNTNGYILDGCPISKEMMESLEAQNIIPYRVIYLKISLEQLEKQAAGVKYESSEFPHLDSLKTFQFQFETYKAHEPLILAWYGEQRNNLLEVPMERSKWWVWIRVVGDIDNGIQSVRDYYEGMSRDGVASLAGMGITPAELKKRLGHFEEFCPVSFVDKDELVDLSQSKTIEYAAEFKGTYYRLAGKAELAKFLKNHMVYVSKFGLPPPQCRPIRRSKEEASKAFGAKIGLLGFCPVTYFEGDQLYNSLVRGNPELAVQYLDTIYYFTSEENLLKFMRSPKKYHNLKTPTIIPPDLPPLKYTSLPIPGYLEQSVSQDIIKALTAVGNFKPKYPFLSPQESAVTYIALYLKAHNLKSSVFTRKRFHRKLKEFEDRCDLVKYLNSNMSRAYKEESDRPSSFDSKLEEFFRLERSSAGEKRKFSFL